MFELRTSAALVERRNKPVADTSLINPATTNAFVPGEWLEENSSGQLVRGTAGEKVYPVLDEKGRYDVSAVGKLTVALLGQYEAETDIVDMTGLADGDKLMVGSVTIAGVSRRGLLKSTGASGVVEVGYVTKLLSSTKIRFIHTHNHKVP